MGKKKTVRKIEKTRTFTEDARKSIVREIEKGLSKSEASRKYKISLTTIYRWLNLYSSKFKTQAKSIVHSKKEVDSYKSLQTELKQVYELLGRSQTEVLFLNKIIELASAELDIDLKKSFGIGPLQSSKK